MSENPTVLTACRESMDYRDLLKNLTQRELRGRYRRTFLGWGWSLMQPILMTAVYAIMLGWYFKVKPAPGDPSGIDNYAFFLLAGVLPWNFFAASLTTSMGTIVGAGGLMTRVWFPRQLLPLSTVLALAFSLCIEMGLLTVVVSLTTGHFFLIRFLPVTIVLIGLELLFTSGIAFWLAACNVRFRDVEYLTTVLLLAYFYMTPIIYDVTFIPDTVALGPLSWRDLALANPMARFGMAYRNVLYDGRLPGLPTMLWVVGWSLFSAYAGTRFFIRRADRFAELM